MRQRTKSGTFANGEKSLLQCGSVHVFSDVFDVDAQLEFTAHCDQRYVRRVRSVELRRARILVGCKLGLAAGQILTANLGSGDWKVAGKQAPKVERHRL